MFKTLTAADGHEFDCWFEAPEGERRGGVVILQEVFGVTDLLKGIARRYAAEGYEVAILTLSDRQRRDAVLPFAEAAEAPKGRDLMLASELDRTMMDVDAALRAPAANGGKVGVIGFCWGGGLAIRAAQVFDIPAAVPFYGTRLPSCQIAPIKARAQWHWGAEDSHVPKDMLDAARAYWPKMEVFVYKGAGHAFANNARPADYVAEAGEKANERARAFLAAHLG
jgi:carboxymethylenebutenolidase